MATTAITHHPAVPDSATVWRIAKGGTRTAAYEQTLMMLCHAASRAAQEGDGAGQAEALHLINTLTDRAHTYDLVLR